MKPLTNSRHAESGELGRLDRSYSTVSTVEIVAAAAVVVVGSQRYQANFELDLDLGQID